MTRAQRLVDRLQVIAPDPKEHYDAILDLTAKAFARRTYWGWRDFCDRGYIAHSNYDFKASRIGLIDGRIATHYGIWDHWMRIGTATVRVAGVGAVATDGAYYKQGLMARTAQRCVDSLAGQGYHLTMLDGIPGFYQRFGYIRAWPDVLWLADVAALPRPPRRPALRRVTSEWADLDRLYNRLNAGLTGTVVRPTYRRNRRTEWQPWCWRSAGRVAGYVVVDPQAEALEVVDHAGDGDEVLGAVAWLASEAGLRKVRFPALHYRSRLCRRLRGLACRCEQGLHRDGGWMARTVALERTLGRLRTVLARRLAAAGLGSWRGELLVQDARERVVLAIGGGRVEPRAAAPGAPGAPRAPRAPAPAHAVRGGEAVVQLLLGIDSPDELAASGALRFSGDGAVLAQALFPPQQPMISYWDYY